MQSHYDLLIVGGGMAAGRLLRRLDELEYKKSVAVVSNEAHAGYNRVLLPGLLAGHYQTSDLTGNDNWAARENFTVLPNSHVNDIDFACHTARINADINITFSELIFATGSTVPRLNIPGATLRNVFELRNIDNAEALRKVAKQATNALVIGGGLLGLEAADALKDLGLKVRIVHRGDQLMNRQLDRIGGMALAQKLLDEGISLSLRTQVEEILGSDKVSSVELNDGTTQATDLVLFATGATPNVALAQQAGVNCSHGVSTDQALRTNVPGVYALGECANVCGNTYSLVEATHAQADALAMTLCGNTQTVAPFTPGTRLKVSSISVFATGETRPAQHDRSNDVRIHDSQEGIYRRLLFSGSKLIGAVLLGNTDAAREITQRIGTAVADRDRDRLAFGIG